MPQSDSIQRRIPSVNRLLSAAVAQTLIANTDRSLVANAYRQATDELRSEHSDSLLSETESIERWLHGRADSIVTESLCPSLRSVYNLSGTVVHTNLGRALLPKASIDAMVAVAGEASNLEYDIASGRRGNRDDHIQQRLCELTGAEAATVVNNNAAAVMLTLNTIADRQSVAVSRGELIEIGDSFRIPDIMQKSGCSLAEVGTTNRTHISDYTRALNEGAVALMRVHASNFSMQGFTSAVTDSALATLAKETNSVFINDLGSGALVDLTRFGLPDEPTAAKAIAEGADVVTFSGDKLLGGPQCGLILGSRHWIDRINQNPIKRALRCDKMTLAALESLLILYSTPDRLVEEVPTLRLLTRSATEIEATAKTLSAPLQSALSDVGSVDVQPCESQVGSGAQPGICLPSFALVITPSASGGTALEKIAADLRRLPIPVIGRLHNDALWLDARCLQDTDRFIANLNVLAAQC